MSTNLMLAGTLVVVGFACAASAQPRVEADFNGDGFADLAVGVPGETVGNADTAGAVNVIYGSRVGLSAAGNQIWTQGADGVDSLQTRGVAEAGDAFGWAVAAGDFNGDGFDDLAVGVNERVGDKQGAGAVNVIYGSRTGLTVAGNQIWTQGAPGVASLQVQGVAGDWEDFGDSLAVGDFNRDGQDDLAVGASGDGNFEPGSQSSQGVVHIIFGSPAGLTLTDNQIWSQSTAWILGVREHQDQFGYALATGDFNGDGYDDLAIGVPGERIGPGYDMGAVNVLYGSAVGLSSGNNQIWTQDTAGIAGVAEDGDRFGEALAAGDFDGDGLDDLAIGVPGESVGGLNEAGAVNILYGIWGFGLVSVNSQIWTQASAGIEGIAEEGDGFGAALTVGDFNGDGVDDLAVGVPEEYVGSEFGAGAVNVLYGLPRWAGEGLTATGNQIWTQTEPGVDSFQTQGTSQLNENFGGHLTAGDFDGDGRDDLAVGVPRDNIPHPRYVSIQAGSVHVIHGSQGRLTPAGNQIWTQDSPGVVGVAEGNDHFGAFRRLW